MPRASSVAPDALRLTERTNAAPFLGKVMSDDLRAHHILSGLTTTTNPDAAAAEERLKVRTARQVIRRSVAHGRTNQETEELLHALGVDWDHASPIPGPEHESAGGQHHERTKRCPRCETARPLSAFHKDSGTRDGLNTWCATCHTEAVAETRKAAAGAPKEVVTEQHCSACNTTRPAEAFTADRYTRTGLSTQCRDCRNTRRRANTKAAKRRASSTRPTTGRKTA